jgi:hypothetical protein
MKKFLAILFAFTFAAAAFIVVGAGIIYAVGETIDSHIPTAPVLQDGGCDCAD